MACKAKGPKNKFPLKGKTEAELLGPLNYTLGRMKSDFELMSQNAKEVVLFNKDKVVDHLNLDEQGVWRCSTPLLKGDAIIKIRYDEGNNWLEGFKFLVK